MLLLLRLITAGLFLWAASVKFGWFTEAANPIRDLRQSIQGFYLVPEHITDPLAYLVPWTELVCALALLVGFWGRSAAVVLGGMLMVFIGAILSVIARPDIDVSCGCFGKFTLMCPPGEVGWCNVGQNAILFALALPVMLWGPGALSLDSLSRRRGAGCEGEACGASVDSGSAGS